MDKIFETIFTSGTITFGECAICLAAALITGFIFSFVLYYFSTETTKSFFIATGFLPITVALVIMLVNGNIGAGVAVAGAFSLVRFRSASGTAKEIGVIFASMAAGLAFGMGYIAYGVCFALLATIVFTVFSVVKIPKKRSAKTKKLTITLPEDVDYTKAFNETFGKFLIEERLVKVKTINFGSMFKATFEIVLKNENDEKLLIDELRVRNANLEIVVCDGDFEKSEL